jgi:cytochrome c biogenesis protein CcmG/thiol:disulfide interchange protein DsbE
LKSSGSKLNRNVKTGLVLAFIAALLFLFIRPDYRQGEASIHGKAAKNFEFTLNGKPQTLADLRGKVVVLNFWATWCPPCVEETPSLVLLQKRIAPMGGTILGVSLDDDASAYADFLKKNNIDFPTYRDATKKSALDYGTTMYPETYVIDRDGRIDRKIIGPQDWTGPEMTAYFNSVLDARN